MPRLVRPGVENALDSCDARGLPGECGSVPCGIGKSERHRLFEAEETSDIWSTNPIDIWKDAEH